MSMVIERRWIGHGLECAVALVHGRHRCGYVRVPEDHPWYGLDYRDEVPNPKPIPEDATIHDYGMAGVIAVLADEVPESVCRVEMQVRVHGGVTWAGPHSDLGDGWWFGFDCAHAYDTPEKWTNEATAAETQRLAEQLASFAEVAA